MTGFAKRFFDVVERRRFIFLALAFIAAAMLRSLAAGFEYLPILDDSIQHINYPSSADYSLLIESEGLFSSRPMAAIMDLYFVGQLRFCFMIPVLIFAVLYALSGVLFLRVFERYFGTGAAFTVIYSLLPLGVEGTYWLSASSRIVPGLFFMALSASLLDDYIREGGWARVPTLALTMLLSFSFYESVLLVAVTLYALMFLWHLPKKRQALVLSVRKRTIVCHSMVIRRHFAALLLFPMAGIYFLFTSAHTSDSALGSRMELVPPTGAWYYDTFLPNIAGQIKEAFVDGGFATLLRGFYRGITGSGSPGGILYLLLAVGIGVLLYLLLPHSLKNKLKCPHFGVWIWGFLLFLAPISIYFFIANPWFSLRGTVTSFIGIALIADALLRLICRRERIYAIAVGALTAVFLIAGASEVRDYYAVARYDERLAAEILSKTDEMTGRVGLVGVEEFPLISNFDYHEHPASAGQSDWSLYGKLVAVSGGELQFYPVPLATAGETFYKGWNTDIKRIAGYDQLWLWDGELLTRLTPVKLDGEQDFSLVLPDGTVAATVTEIDGVGYFEYQ